VSTAGAAGPAGPAFDVQRLSLAIGGLLMLDACVGEAAEKLDALTAALLDAPPGVRAAAAEALGHARTVGWRRLRVLAASVARLDREFEREQ
jgi:hypothetical protein